MQPRRQNIKKDAKPRRQSQEINKINNKRGVRERNGSRTDFFSLLSSLSLTLCFKPVCLSEPTCAQLTTRAPELNLNKVTP
jgi:hypothetical protein